MNTYSPSGYKLNTGKQARQSRAFKALSHLAPIGLLDCNLQLQGTGQNSSSILALPNGLNILISYESVAAFRHPDGSFVATERGRYSRTTDRAVTNFAPGDCIRLDHLAFEDSLRIALRR